MDMREARRSTPPHGGHDPALYAIPSQDIGARTPGRLLPLSRLVTAVPGARASDAVEHHEH